VGSIANVASGGELTVSDGEGLGSRARLVAGLAWCGYLDCGAGVRSRTVSHASGGELTVSDGEGLGSRARLVAGLEQARLVAACA
jgi:hypothetical protein